MRQLGRGVKIGRRRQIGRLDLERGERGDKKVPPRSLYHATRAFNSPLIDICNKVRVNTDTRAFPRVKKKQKSKSILSCASIFMVSLLRLSRRRRRRVR
jgi:hypothetical protein